jgi:predicted metal-dependent HD superfamily phosphohydrolase
MATLGLAPNDATYQALLDAYSEPHRHYHNRNHLKVVLDLFEETRDVAECPSAVALALWFHDAVYKPMSSTNERDSADWAVRFLNEHHLDSSIIEQVDQLIMATANRQPPRTSDEKLIVDIDLAILGGTEEAFNTFEKHVRQEYKMVPTFLFNKKRKDILKGFLQQDELYHHSYFKERFETRARNNLQVSIDNL